MTKDILRVGGEGVVFIGFWEMQNLIWHSTFSWGACGAMVCLGALAVIAAELLS